MNSLVLEIFQFLLHFFYFFQFFQNIFIIFDDLPVFDQELILKLLPFVFLVICMGLIKAGKQAVKLALIGGFAYIAMKGCAGMIDESTNNTRDTLDFKVQEETYVPTSVDTLEYDLPKDSLDAYVQQ